MEARWAKQWEVVEQQIAAGQGGALLASCDSLLEQDSGDDRSTAQVMRARIVALSMLGRGDELDWQLAELERRFAGAHDPVVRLAAAQALIDRALYLLDDRHDLVGALRDSSEVLERFTTESDDWLAREIANELLGAARHLIWTDPLMNGRVLPWMIIVLGRGVRFVAWSLSSQLPLPARCQVQRWVRAGSNSRLAQAQLITDTVLARSRSDLSLLAYALLRRFTVLVQQGRLRSAIRSLSAFRALGEPAIACIVDNAVPGRGGGYRDTPRIAAALGVLDGQSPTRSASTNAAVRRINAAEDPRALPGVLLRLLRT